MTYAEFRELQEGDVIILAEDFDDSYMSDGMEDYLGDTVTIASIDRDDEWITIIEDGGRWSWNPQSIDVKADVEIVDKIHAKSIGVLKEAYKGKEGVICTPEEFRDIAMGVFGEDRVDFIFRGNIFYITVHFPIVDITNSFKERHTIKDLYVKFTVQLFPDSFNSKTENNANITLSGLRILLSLKEYQSHYGHSHYSDNTGWGEFCLGNSDFNIVLMEAEAQFSEERITLLLLSLENYLKWESVEGGPYQRINAIQHSNSVQNLHADIYRDAISKYANIPPSAWEFNGDLVILEGSGILYDFIRENASIKSVNRYDREKLEKELETINLKLDKSRLGIIWKGKWLPTTVYCDDMFQTSSESVSQEVVMVWADVINEEADKFLKKLQYDNSKQKHSEKVFGTYRALQQASIESDQRTKTKDRLVAQASG